MDKKIESIKKNGGLHIRRYKENNITYDMCVLAISLDCNAIEFVPQKHLSKEIIETVCKSSIEYLKLIPVDVLDEDVWDAVLKISLNAIKYMPFKYINKEICLRAFNENKDNFVYIPQEYMDYDMALAGVNYSGYFIKYIPVQMKDLNICKIAINSGKCDFYDIPSAIWTTELILLFLEKYDLYGENTYQNRPEKWDDIPANAQSYESYLIFARNFKVLRISDIPQEYISKQTYEIIILNNSYEINKIPQELIDEELCKKVVNKDIRSINWIPKKYLNDEVCTIALKHLRDPFVAEAWRYVENVLKTQKVCNLALEKNIEFFSRIPEEFVTEEMLYKVAKEKAVLLKYSIPEKFRTKKIFDNLIKIDNRCEDYINCIPYK